jgi:hypothetical protein
MARPQKETVDYFPHYCNHKRTMFVLEERYGNDGYAFWFKLLEMLGNTKGHYLDLNDASEMEFLLAKTHLSEVSAVETLGLLAKLGAIDPEAWSHKAIWCQNFVDGVAPVYQSRHQPVPTKPSCLAQEPHPTTVMPSRNQPEPDVSMVNNTQTIGDYSRVEKSIYSPIPAESDHKPAQAIFEHWNEQNIVQHRKLDDKTRRAIGGALSACSEAEVVQAIDNYARVLASPEHFFKYKWTLRDFLGRGLDKFMLKDVCWENYRKDHGGGNGANQQGARAYGQPGNQPSGAFDGIQGGS